MEETKRKYWEKEAIRISEMMHRGFYEKTIHPKDLDGYLSQESFSWIGAVEGENYLSKKDAITAFSRQRDLQEVPLIGVGKGRYRVQWVSDTVLLVLSVIPLSTKKGNRASSLGEPAQYHDLSYRGRCASHRAYPCIESVEHDA